MTMNNTKTTTVEGLAVLTKRFFGEVVNSTFSIEDLNKVEVIKEGGKIVKETLKELGVDYKIRKAVVDAYYAENKRHQDNHNVYELFKKDMFGKMRVIKTITLVPYSDDFSMPGLSMIPGFKVQSNSLLVRYYEKLWGHLDHIKSGMIGQETSVIEDSVSVEGGYLQVFNTGKFTAPLNRMLSLEFGALIKALGADDETVESLWKDVHKNGILYDGRFVYRNTPKFREKVGASGKLYIVAAESPSALKNGSVLMFDMGTNDIRAARAKLEGTRNVLDDKACEIMRKGFSQANAPKYMKRVFSMSAAAAICIGSIDLSKYCIAVKKDKWVDAHDLGKHSTKLEECPLDGQAFIRLSFILSTLREYFNNMGLTELEVLVSNMQLRLSALAGKSFCKIKDDEIFDVYMEEIKADPSYEIIGNKDGQCVLIADKNVMKYLAEYLKAGVQIDQIKLFVMNFSHESKNTVNLGSQTSNKFDFEMRDAYDNYVCSQLVRSLNVIIDSAVDGKEGETMRPFETAVDLVSKVKGKKAIYTSIVQSNLIDVNEQQLSPVAKQGKVKVPGCTLAVSMEEAPVIAKNKFFNLLTCNDGVFEMYSADMLRNRRELFVDYMNNRLDEIASYCKFNFVAMKYPSQGRHEHLRATLVTLEELAIRAGYGYQLLVQNGMDLDEAAKLAYMVVFNTKFDGAGTILMCNSNIAANWLAGFDKDFDKLTIITSRGFVGLVHKKIESFKEEVVDTDGNKATVTGQATCISSEKVSRTEGSRLHRNKR